MGGLVSRAMIQRKPDVWKRMRGRVVMLGTPNLGSFAPVLAFSGRDTKLRALAFLDRDLNKDDVVRVVATFPGLYQMLPSKAAGLGADIDALYDRHTWPEPVVHQSLLDGSAAFQESIAGVIETQRMLYVAGYGHKTVDGIRRSNGKLEWRHSKAGDGTVPHTLGRLPGVVTFWSGAKHGSLPKDDRVLAAIDDLLLTGTTENLPSGADPPGGRLRGPQLRSRPTATDQAQSSADGHGPGRPPTGAGDRRPRAGRWRPASPRGEEGGHRRLRVAREAGRRN